MGENPTSNFIPRVALSRGEGSGEPPTQSVRTAGNPLAARRNGSGGDETHYPTFAPPAPPGGAQRLEFEPNLFQGRIQEREWLEHKVREILLHRIARPLVEIIGPLALGKTWLLRLYDHKYAKGHKNERARSLNTFTTFIDFKKLDAWNDSEFSWAHHFLRLLNAELNAEGFTHSFQHPQVYEPEPQFPLDPYERTETVKELTNWIEQLAAEYVPILLFDSSEVVPSVCFDWFEQELVAPLIRTHRALVVVAGRYPRVWREPETSQRREQWILNELEQEVWHKQAANRKGELIPPWVHERYARGYPGVALDLYQRFLGLGQDKLERIREVVPNSPEEHDLVSASIQETLNELLFQGIEPQLPELVGDIATQRIFNPDLLQDFVKKFGAADKRARTFPYFRQKVRELIDANVAKFSLLVNDYVIHPPLRRLVAECVRVTQGPENVRARHQFAFDYFLRRLDQAPEMTAEWFVPEILFHHGEIANLKQPGTAPQQVAAKLDELLKGKFGEIALDKLTERMARWNSQAPVDIDLVELHRDLVWRIGEANFEKLVQELRAHNQRFDVG